MLYKVSNNIDDIDNLLYQLKKYIKTILLYHL